MPRGVAPPRRPDPEPLQGDDVLTVAVGTGLWLLVAILLIPFHAHLHAQGHDWFLGTAFCGTGLGLLGLLVTTRRRRRLAQAAAQSSRSSSSADSSVDGPTSRAT